VIAARVEEMIPATEGGGKKVHARYVALGKSLARPGRGLAGDFRRLGAVSTACNTVLSADAPLRAGLDGALDAGESLLEERDVEAVTRAALLEGSGARGRVLDAAAAARAAAGEAAALRAGGQEADSIRRSRRAASAFERVLALAERLRQRQLGAPAWGVPLQELGGALLSVWGGSGPLPDLYAVGADDGQGPLFLRLARAGEAWVRVPVAPAGDLWWVTGVPGDGVWASGTGGTVVRLDPATGVLEDRSTGEDAILYGIWGSGPTDVWAVGGDPDGVGPRPAICHWNGSAWSIVAPPVDAEGRMLFKVWGSQANDVWACGQGGTLLHYDGAAWTSVDSATSSTLFTVNGADPSVAVGGVAAVIVERGTDGTWKNGKFQSAQGGLPGLNGVFVPAPGTPVAVGFSATVLRREGDTWQSAPGVPAAARDFHAVWVDDEGNEVMAGGNLLQLTRGHLVTHGRRALPSTVLSQARLAARVQPVLYGSCALAACHTPPFANHGLDFTTASSTRSTAVNVPSAESPLLRVLPGRPSQSYLWHKVSGTQVSVGGSGDPMPKDAGPLAAEDLDAIRAWIAEGALDN